MSLGQPLRRTGKRNRWTWQIYLNLTLYLRPNGNRRTRRWPPLPLFPKNNWSRVKASLADAARYVVGTYIVDDQAIPNLGFGGIAAGLFTESGNVKLMIDGVPVGFDLRPATGLAPS